MAPVPWYWDYFQVATRCNCSPWELVPGYGTDEGWTPPEFWFAAGRIILDAEYAIQEYHNRKSPGSASPDPNG